MKTAKYLNKNKVIERGIKALHRELGPIEARRFIVLASSKHEDSVGHHRKWQESLDGEVFISQVMNEYKK